MARKKNAEKGKIEAVPVLRTNPVPDPEETPTTKSYCVRDDWKDKSIVNYVAFKSVDGEVQDLLVNGEPAGGGGMSTCSVEINNTTADEVSVGIVYVAPGLIGDNHFDYPYYAAANTAETITTIASDYNKVLLFGHTVAVSGAITFDEVSQVATISGDGSITIS